MKTRPFPAVRPRRIHRAVQYGFSLIELMVAIGMALFLAAGLISTVVTLKGTFNSQDQMGQLQENQRFILTVLSNTVHNAGYFVAYANGTRTDAFHALSGVNPDATDFSEAQFITGSVGATSDTLDIRYQTADGDTLTNCQGGSNNTGTGAPITWVNTFAVNAANQLVCSVGVEGAAPPASDPMVLADQVASMRILYGVDTAGQGNADTYLPASGMTDVLWGQVRSVQLQLTFLDPIKSKPGAPQPLPSPLVQTISLMNAQ